MTQLTCFKAYDIRGQLGTELNEEIAYRIGRAYGAHLKPKNVVVGYDIRLSSESLKNALVEGLRDASVDVIDIGLAGTEEVYFATFFSQADGGIEITASHNPIDYNGMKLVGHSATPISSDSGLIEIKNRAENSRFTVTDIAQRGSYQQRSFLKEYIDHLLQYINTSYLTPLKLVVNSGNGAAGHVIDALEAEFIKRSVPITIIKVHHQADGTFPNGIPNPLLPECRSATEDAVKKHTADLGIAFDGDFDRCFFFDEQGNYIEGYYIVGLLANAFLQKFPGSKIVHDPRLTWNTIDVVERQGGIPIVTKTGHAFFKEKMREEDAIYGGEMSSHHYFRDFAYCDSGMLPWLLIIELLSLKKQKMSELVNSRISAYPSSGEINRKISDPKAVLELVLSAFSNGAQSIKWIDGLSIDHDTWRFSLRSSNTEPLVRLNVESIADRPLMEKKTAEILALLEPYVLPT